MFSVKEKDRFLSYLHLSCCLIVSNFGVVV